MVTEIDDKSQIEAPDNVKAEEAGAPALPHTPMNAAGMGYHGHGYQMPPQAGAGFPGHGFPPQPMMPGGMPPPMGPGGGGMPHMMMAPPPHPQSHPYSVMAGVSGPPERKGNGNGTQVCVVHPEGMPRAFDAPFPERKLPVCDRCKKNFRSRELCRTRDGHKALPWQTTYVVVTLTDEVLEKGGDGELTYADIPVVGELQDMPELCRGPADGSMSGEPICKVCKEKNYTRDHCRNTLKHTTPPYNAAYVKLVKKQGNEDDLMPTKKKKKRQEENADGKPRPSLDMADDPEKAVLSDDLTVIHQSRTFFASISSKKITVKWCEQIQYPETSKNATSQAPMGYNNNNMMPPYMNMPGNPAMHGQLWDAFRAGAMWHFSQTQQQGGHMNMMGMGMPPAYGHGGNYAPPPASYAPAPSPNASSTIDSQKMV